MDLIEIIEHPYPKGRPIQGTFDHALDAWKISLCKQTGERTFYTNDVCFKMKTKVYKEYKKYLKYKYRSDKYNYRINHEERIKKFNNYYVTESRRQKLGNV